MKYALSAISPIALLAVLASPAQAQVSPQYVHGGNSVYRCDNGLTLDVARHVIGGNALVEVSYMDRLGGEVRRISQMLASSQSGSGVRYTTDMASFHESGDEAVFASAEGAATTKVESTNCKVTAPDGAAPLTMGAHAGHYFAITPDSLERQIERPIYRPIENLCIAQDGSGYFALVRDGEPNGGLLISQDGLATINVGEADAGAGNVRFAITSRNNASLSGSMNFISQGMREQDQPSATASMSSVEVDGVRTDCLDDDRLVYSSVSGTGETLVVVSIFLEDGELVYRSIGGGNTREVRGGYFVPSQSAGQSGGSFHFFARQMHLQVYANSAGAMPFDSVMSDQNGLINGATPMAYFIADPALLYGTQTLDSNMIGYFARAEICNHLAGEFGGDAERNAQLNESWEAQSCEALSAFHAAEIARSPAGGPLQSYLKANGPVWE